MLTRHIVLLPALGLCLTNLSCANRPKSIPEPGTLAAAIHECRQAQHQHYLTAGMKPIEKDDEDEIVRYTVYEGVPNFIMRDCMEAQLPEGTAENHD